jgi:hypothetical protein
MNGYDKLRARIAELERVCNRYSEGMTDLEVYLTSSKFYEDTTVQTTDVLNRLSELKNYAETEK